MRFSEYLQESLSTEPPDFNLRDFLSTSEYSLMIKDPTSDNNLEYRYGAELLSIKDNSSTEYNSIDIFDKLIEHFPQQLMRDGYIKDYDADSFNKAIDVCNVEFFFTPGRHSSNIKHLDPRIKEMAQRIYAYSVWLTDVYIVNTKPKSIIFTAGTNESSKRRIYTILFNRLKSKYGYDIAIDESADEPDSDMQEILYIAYK